MEFAQTQKELFKFLYLRKRKNGEKIIDDVNYDATIALLSKNLEMTETQAKDMHRWMQYYCYTQGVMLATDYRDLSLQEMGKELTELSALCFGTIKPSRVKKNSKIGSRKPET